MLSTLKAEIQCIKVWYAAGHAHTINGSSCGVTPSNLSTYRSYLGIGESRDVRLWRKQGIRQLSTHEWAWFHGYDSAVVLGIVTWPLLLACWLILTERTWWYRGRIYPSESLRYPRSECCNFQSGTWPAGAFRLWIWNDWFCGHVHQSGWMVTLYINSVSCISDVVQEYGCTWW